MGVERGVFISYRRTNVYMARAVYQDLTHNGYDVFLDFESIDTGSFEQIILNQIAARAHFIIILTPSALEQCSDPHDWVRREIEHALKMKRNIVPLMFEGFNFASVNAYLVGQLTALRAYNALNVHSDYFDEAMERLRARFLSKPLDVILHPTPSGEADAVRQAQEKEAAQPTVQKQQLTAEQWLEHGLGRDKKDLDGQIADYSEAIRLNPQYGAAYNNRGLAYDQQGDVEKAIADFDVAIQINPKHSLAYNNRAVVYYKLGEWDQVIADCNQAIELNPKSIQAYVNRGDARKLKGNLDGAIEDFNEAIRLNVKSNVAYSNRAEVLFEQRKFTLAMRDFNKANAMVPGDLYVLAGLAVTNHALHNMAEAGRLWKLLVAVDKRYLDAGWVRQEMNWSHALVDEARKLIAGLG